MKLFKFAMEGRLLRKLIDEIVELIDRMNQFLVYLFYAMLNQTDNKKIMLFTSRGTYDCNPSFIADELLKKGEYKLIWAVNESSSVDVEQYPEGLALVRYGSLEYYKQTAKSKIWIDNAMNTVYTIPYKKKDQILIQTWHGSIGLKRFDTNSDKKWIKKAKKSARWTDYIISNSSFESKLYRDTFWKDTKILEFGHPRNDIFYDEGISESRGNKAIKSLGLKKDVKYCIYAPTFRDSKGSVPYRLDFESVKQALEKRFGGKWKIIVRMHFQTGLSFKSNSADVIDASSYANIQDILAVCDAGITDYSCWICDYVLTKKPAFFYCPDYNSYLSERGFLYPLESTPFPISKNNSELVDNIENFDINNYQKQCTSFIQEKGCIDDGFASKRTADFIDQILNEK